jgi:hypothetical protein
MKEQAKRKESGTAYRCPKCGHEMFEIGQKSMWDVIDFNGAVGERTQRALSDLEKLRKRFSTCVQRLARALADENLPEKEKWSILLGAIEETLDGLLGDIAEIDDSLISTMLEDMRRKFVHGRGEEIHFA